MTKTYNLSVSVSDKTQKVFDDLGLSLSDAFNIFLDRVDKEGRMPFDYPEEDFEIEISSEEILQKLEEAEEDIKAGRTISLEEFKENINSRRKELRKRYRREYCEKDGYSITYTDDDVCFEKTDTAEALLIANGGKIVINNFDNETLDFLLNWYHKIYSGIVSFRTLDRMEDAV